MKNLTVKIFVGLFVVAAVLLQSCKKDSETYSFLLNERGAFVEEPGGTTSLGFTAINISSVTPTTVPQGWSVTVDMNERRISVTGADDLSRRPEDIGRRGGRRGGEYQRQIRNRLSDGTFVRRIERFHFALCFARRDGRSHGATLQLLHHQQVECTLLHRRDPQGRGYRSDDVARQRGDPVGDALQGDRIPRSWSTARPISTMRSAPTTMRRSFSITETLSSALSMRRAICCGRGTCGARSSILPTSRSNWAAR